MALPVLSAFMLCLACGGKTDSTETTDTSSADTASTEANASTGFDELASDYYERDTRVIWQKPSLVIGLLGNLTGKTVADIGAGTGYFAFRIAAAGGKVIAIDIDERAIAWMESEKSRYPEEVQERFTTRLAEPDDPKLTQNEADIVLLVNTYIYIEDRPEYFERLHDGLKPNGILVIVDFKNIPTGIGPKLEERIPVTQVQQELGAAGYTIKSTDESSLEYQYIVTAETRE